MIQTHSEKIALLIANSAITHIVFSRGVGILTLRKSPRLPPGHGALVVGK